MWNIYYLVLFFFTILLYYIYSLKIKEKYDNKNNKETKIIILIISSNNFSEYADMYEIWKKYMNIHPNIQSFFIENDKFLDRDVVLNKENNTIYCKGEENYIPGILNKTIKSIDYCLNNLEFDYIYRTNLSTVVNLDKLYSYVKNNNDNINYAGNISKKNNFIYGTGILLSKNACQKLVSDKSLINHDIIDDVAIAIKLKEYYKMINIDRYWIENTDDKLLNDNEYYNIITNRPTYEFRCKSKIDSHKLTVLIMSTIYDKIYG
jgi:hypothetical protein